MSEDEKGRKEDLDPDNPDDSTAEEQRRAEETLAWLRANPRFNEVQNYEDDEEEVEATITFIPKMSEEARERLRAERAEREKRDGAEDEAD